MDVGIKKLMEGVSSSANFNRVAKNLNIVEVRTTPTGFVKAELKVEESHCNAGGTLHGAMMCMMIDLLGGMAWAAAAGLEGFAPSVELNVSFIRSAKLGETIVAEGRCLKNGRSIVFTEVDIYRKDDRALIASGRHSLMKSRL